MVDGYTLIIAEKPDAAERIAAALSPNFKKKTELKIPYYEFKRDGKKILVVPTSGHVYTVAQERGGRNYYPVFTFGWMPKYMVERGNSRVKNIIALFEKLSVNAEDFINAADYDIEGSLIGYMILKYACNDKEKESKRMKFSTLTKEELNQAYENMMTHLDFEMAEAGRARHEVDWLYGINLSRALTLSAAKQNMKYNTLSIGRVQGPTLNFIVQREAEIKSFVPNPFWEIKALAEIDGVEYELKFEKDRIEKKNEAEDIVKKCSGKIGKIVLVEEKELRRSPPEPFDLGSLQREAYRFFGFTPRRSLDIAEGLYLNALVSYPRTSSQKLPQTINYTEILQNLSRNHKYEDKSKLLLSQGELKPYEGKKEDPAHPAIYPTGTFPEKELSTDETKIYDLIVKRFMATFSKPSTRLSTKVAIELDGYLYFLYGGRIIEEGWISFYRPYVEVEEVILPPLKVGQEVFLKNVESTTKFTEPPPRYNPASLLKVMEENGIGTKATRAEIIDTLYERGYVRDERIVATDLGFAVVETLTKYCPDIISVQLTRDLEEEMEKIENNREKREKVLVEDVDDLKLILKHIKNKEKEIGVELTEAIQAENLRKRIVGQCPNCKTGKLIILRSRKTSKRFIGCMNFFAGLCKMSLPLPQKATVQTTEKTCKTCGWPMIIIKPYKRHLFQVCINPNCPSKLAKS